MVRKPTRDTERIGRETCGFSEVEMLLQEFWDDRYVGYCERLREVTRVGYESAWRCHVEPVFGSMELADIGVDDIELWLSGFASPGAARKAWAVLRQMLRKAAKWGYLEVDVTRRRYASWCKKESLPYVPVQNLRHSWATNALEAGVNIAVVSKFLGHTDIKTTARFYLRPEIASLKEAQSIWERALIGQ